MSLLMIPRVLFLRSFTHDKIFQVLFILSVLTFILAMAFRRPALEHTSIVFSLGLFFFLINMLFAFLTLRREPLLSYMFLTATILLNGTLFFFFRYLIMIQVG